MFTEDWKKQLRQSAKKEILTNNQEKKYNSMKNLKGNNFYSRRRVLRVKCLLKILSHE